MENGVFRRSDMTIKIKVLNVWGSVILKKWELGFFNFVSLYCDILLSLRGRYGGEA